MICRFTLYSFFILISLKARAFPEMVRHGYMNCTACHTSLVGGNLLNPYGRSLSKDLLSEKSGGESEMVVNPFSSQKWLQVGGDLRLLQTFRESETASQGRFFIMQVELGLLAQVSESLNVFFAMGRMEPRKEDPTAKDFVYLPRWGLDYAFNSPDETNQTHLRLGRFAPAFGINYAEHVFVTRTLLDFGPGQERFAAELSWLNDQFSVIGTAIGGLTSANENRKEQGGILQFSTAVGEKSKVGLNYYQTQKENLDIKYTRKIQGAFAYVGFSEDWYGLFEVDSSQGADLNWGLIETSKIGKEIHQGLQVFATHEFANLNVINADPKYEAYGIGAQWFPAVHWDLYGVYRKEKNSGTDKQFQDVAWLLGHFYL